MKRAAHIPASCWGKTGLCSASLPSHDLVDALFRNTAGLGDTRSSLTSFVTRNDSSVPVGFLGRTISLRCLREWAIAQHLHDMESSQPDIEASCGFVPLRGTKRSDQPGQSDVILGTRGLRQERPGSIDCVYIPCGGYITDRPVICGSSRAPVVML
jgi:hypothetical protein